MRREPVDDISTELSLTLDDADLVKYLHHMDTSFKKAGLNDAAKFSLIRQ